MSKGKLIVCVAMISSLAIGFGSCTGSSGGGGGGTSSVTATIAPTGTAEYANVAVTATFSGAITAPSSWASVFTLVSEGSSENLCTADSSYDEAALSATCAHVVLNAGIVYTATVSGVTDADGKTIANASASFTTSSADSSVASVTKTSATKENSNTIEMTFGFSNVVPADRADPTLTVLDPDGDPVSVDGCAFNTARDEFSCNLLDIESCNEFYEYTYSLAGTGFEAYAYAFNSADYEFEQNLIGENSCWRQNKNDDESASISLADGALTISAPLNSNDSFSKTADPDVLSANIGWTISVAQESMEATESCSLPNSFASFLSRFHYDLGGGVTIEYALGRLVADTTSVYHGWLLRYDLSAASDESAVYGDFVSTNMPFYICVVKRDDVIIPYFSTDGSSFTALTTSDLTEIANTTTAPPITPDDMVAFDTSAVGSTGNVEFAMGNWCTEAASTITLDSIRFSTSFSGDRSGADCPRF